MSTESVSETGLTEEDRSVTVKESVDNSAVQTGTGNNATITIINYYYGENTTLAPAESTDAADEALPCPYRGLFHFGPNDAEVFFGRKIFVEELYSATKTRNFIPVLGASGSGKSSVVLAGLVPKLQKEGHWQFTHFRPGPDPFHALAEALVPLYRSEIDSTDQITQASKLAKSLKDGTPLFHVFSSIQRHHINHRVLLIADQFEEIYTLCNDDEIRRKFLNCLLDSLGTPNSLSSSSSSATVLVLTMRADFLGNALSYRPFADVLQNADLKLGPMNHEELSEVIEKPADKLGVTFEERLVKQILKDVKDQPGNLPLLEFALTELWNKRTGKQLTHKIYGEIGQVEGALARHADEKYSNLTDKEKEKVRRIFIQLVRPGEGTEDTRRIAMKAELGEQSWSLVKQLADARLVVTSRNANSQETVEVVHEALIRNWGELREWMNTDRVFRAWQERLRVRMYQWEQTQRDEGALLRGAALADAEEKLKQRQDDLSKGEKDFIQASVELRDREQKQRERRSRLTFFGLTAFSLLALGLAGLAGIGWRNAAISEINSLAQSSDGFLNLDGAKALKSSIGAVVNMQNLWWGEVDASTRTQVELTLVNTVNNVAAPNTLGGHANSVNGVSFSPDGNMLASASDDNTVKLWNSETGKEINTLTGHTDVVWGVSFSPDGNMLASASADGTVKLWNSETGEEINTLTGHKGQVNKVDFSPDGTMLASTSHDKTVKLWKTETGELINPLSGHKQWIWGVSFSPDGKMLASGSHDRTVKLWNTTTGEEIETLEGHKKEVWGVSFSPDGNMLASASADQTIKLWNTDTGEEIELPNLLDKHEGEVWEVSFSPDGNMLASASIDKTVKLWDSETGIEINTLTGHEKEVGWISFSPDGKRLASASNDGTVKLWNTETGIEINTPTRHEDGAWGVSFSPDGKMLASSGADKTIKLWNTSTDKVKVNQIKR